MGDKPLNPRAVIWWSLRRSSNLRKVKRVIKRTYLESPRRVPRDLGVSGLFQYLNREQCKYVVLRWFEDLPRVDERGDIDILIDDDDAYKLDSILTRSSRKGDIQCDVYSSHGLPSFSYKRYAYYPPAIAHQILQRSVAHTSGALVPAPVDHFYSLAFHALYHKGYYSGLPPDDSTDPRVHSNRHDYAGELLRLANEAGIPVPINMASLDAELVRVGWRPPPDTLMKWAVENSYCRELVNSMFHTSAVPDGLMVCLVREVAGDSKHIAQIRAILHQYGFDPIMIRELDRPEIERATSMVRGGNWGRGPYPQSGGPPSVLIAAIDPKPSSPSKALLRRHPGVDNERVFKFKEEVRNWWNERVPEGQGANIIHSSDNAAHAMHYIQTIAPHAVDEIRVRNAVS